MTAQPDISVIIPVYNRGGLLRLTLDSVARATSGVSVEIVVVDDGSNEPVSVPPTRGGPTARVIRQSNQGLLFARLTGLSHASGRYTLFLDSDDFISPQKLRAHVTAMDGTGAVVSYSDAATIDVKADGSCGRPVLSAPFPSTRSLPELLITIQPPPHCPVFDTAWLKRCVDNCLFAPTTAYNPVAEIWFYHLGAILDGAAVHVPGPHAIIGSHAGARLTNHWEKLGVASLAVMEAFAMTCPSTTAAQRLSRQLVGLKAWGTWRRLARGVPREFEQRLLSLAEALSSPALRRAAGGRWFRSMAAVIGTRATARIFRRVQTPAYPAWRTISDAEFLRLLAAIPPPPKL